MLQRDHLTEEEIAICAEAISSGRYAMLEKSFRSHLEACPQCGNEVLMVSEINKQAEASKLINRNRKNKVRILITIASAAALLLFLVMVYFQSNIFPDQQQFAESVDDSFETTDQGKVDDLRLNAVEPKTSGDSKPEKEIVNKDENSVQKGAQTEQLAHYEANPVLENLYNNYRNSYRSSGFSYSGPGILDYPDSDQLEWSNPGKINLDIDIFNNRNVKLITLTTAGSVVKIPDLLPGLYYFKIVNEDFDLLYVGKIRVKESPGK